MQHQVNITLHKLKFTLRGCKSHILARLNGDFENQVNLMLRIVESD